MSYGCDLMDVNFKKLFFLSHECLPYIETCATWKKYSSFNIKFTNGQTQLVLSVIFIYNEWIFI